MAVLTLQSEPAQRREKCLAVLATDERQQLGAEARVYTKERLDGSNDAEGFQGVWPAWLASIEPVS